MAAWQLIDWASDFWNQALLVLLDSGAKGLVLLALAALATAAMRRASAASRHLAWTLAMAGLLLLPFRSHLIPQFQLPVLPAAPQAVMPVPAHPPEAPASLARSAVHTPERPMTTPAPSTAPGAKQAQSQAPAPASSTAPRVVAPIAASAPVIPAARAPLDSPAPLPRLAWLLAAWLAGALAILIAQAAGVGAVMRLVRRSRPFAAPEWAELTRSLSAALGLRRRVRVRCAGPRIMPMTTGLLRPTILLPREADTWSPEKRQSVLLHELAHIKRHDCLTQALGRLAVALHWFNPLAWLALRRLRIERERACDDLVLAAGERPSAYAGHLLDIARTMHAGRLASAAAITMAPQSQLEGRLLSILDATRKRRAVTRWTLGAGVLLLLAIVIPLSVPQLGRRNSARQKFQPSAPSAQRPANPGQETIFAQVVDAGGKPVPGARVEMRQWYPAVPASKPLPSATSDANGRVALPPVQAGDTILMDIKAEGFLPRREYNIDKIRDTPSIFPEKLKITIHRPGTLEGVVLAPGGKPLAAAPLSLTTFEVDGGTTANALRAIADDQGRFRMENVPPGRHLLYYPWEGPSSAEVDRGVWDKFKKPGERWPSAPVSGVCGALVIDVADGQAVQNLTMDLSQSTAAVEGRVLDFDGAPVKGASVYVFWQWERGGTSIHGEGYPPAVTDAQGRYRLKNLPPGHWFIGPTYPADPALLLAGRTARLDFRLDQKQTIPQNIAPREKSGQTVSRDLNEQILALGSNEYSRWGAAVSNLSQRKGEAAPAVPALVRALNQEQKREQVLGALREIGPAAREAVPALIWGIGHWPGGNACRWNAALALDKIGPAAVPALDQAAQSSNTVTSIWAHAVLMLNETMPPYDPKRGTYSIAGPIGPYDMYDFINPGYLPHAHAIGRYLGNPDSYVASEALNAIKMAGPKAARLAPMLTEILKLPSPRLPKTDLIEALERIGPASHSAIPEIIKYIDAQDPRTRIEAIRAVKAIGGDGARAAVLQLRGALGARASSNPVTTAYQATIQSEAAEALGMAGEEARPALPELMGLLGDPNENVRASATQVIGDIIATSTPVSPQATAGLIKAMKDPSIKVSQAANGALLQIGPANIEIIRAFIGAVRDHAGEFSPLGDRRGPPNYIINACESFFMKLGPEQRYAMPDIAELARHQNSGVQRIAFQALGRIGEVPEDLMPELIKFTRELNSYWAFEALRKLGPKAAPAAPAMIGLLRKGGSSQKHSAITVLEAIGLPGAKGALPELNRLLRKTTNEAIDCDLFSAILKLDPASTTALEGLDKLLADPVVEPQTKLSIHALRYRYGKDPQADARALQDALPAKDTSICAISRILDTCRESGIRKAALEKSFEIIQGSDTQYADNAAFVFYRLVPSDLAAYPGLLPRLIAIVEQSLKVDEQGLPTMSAGILNGAIEGLGRLGPAAREALPALEKIYQASGGGYFYYYYSRENIAKAIRKIRAGSDH